MSSITLIPPKLIAPKMLKTLSNSMIGQGTHDGTVFRKFPLMHMEDIFAAYTEGREGEVSTIDHFRLAMALIVNLHTITEGKDERYSDLCSKYLPQQSFIETIFRKTLREDVFLVYLKKIFLRHEVVKNPHRNFMEKFHMHAIDEDNLPEKLEILVKIKENKVNFLKNLVNKCLVANKSLAVIWDSYDLLEDDYVRDNYLIPAEDLLLDELIKQGHKADIMVLRKFLVLLLDFKCDTKNLTRRFEKLVFAAEKTDLFQKPVIEILESNLGNPPNWDLLPGVNQKAVEVYERLCGLVEFHQFEIISNIIWDNFEFESQADKSRLKNRTVFLMNYRKSIKRIKIFLSGDSNSKLTENFNSYQEKYSFSKDLLFRCGRTNLDTEVVFILLRDILIVEFFRGSGWDTLVVPKGLHFFEEIKSKRELNRGDLGHIVDNIAFYVHHNYLWQVSLTNVLFEKYGIDVDAKKVLVPINAFNTFEEKLPIDKANAINKSSSKIKENYGDYQGLLSATILYPDDVVRIKTR